MYVYIYIYIYIYYDYFYDYAPGGHPLPGQVPGRGRAELPHPGLARSFIRVLLYVKGGLEYGVRPPVFYGSLREKTVFHEYLQEACCVLTEISESLRKPLGVYGRT